MSRDKEFSAWDDYDRPRRRQARGIGVGSAVLFTSACAAASFAFHEYQVRSKAAEAVRLEQAKAEAVALYIRQSALPANGVVKAPDPGIISLDQPREVPRQNSFNAQNYTPRSPASTYSAQPYAAPPQASSQIQRSGVTIVGRASEAEAACERVTRKGSIERRECIMQYNLAMRNKGGAWPGR
ncbi:hypothetical protein [Pseudomonas sp. Marseille-QA0892]